MDTLIAGATMQRERYEYLYTQTSSTAHDQGRNNWALFTQYEHGFDAKNSMTVGARETWTSGAAGGRNFHNFSASGQWLNKMDTENSLYASISQSFIMPTLAQLYGTSRFYEANPDLTAQKGVNYEIGWKANHGAHAWKAALFHTDIRDNINASPIRNTDRYQYTNEDFRNTGLELSWDIKDATPFSYHWGATWQNPESKSSKKGYWDRKFGRIQLTGGVRYHEGKWSSDLSASFLGARVQTPSSEHSFDAKPYLLTKWNTIYAPDAQNELSLAITNVLDRHDIISHAGVTYYNSPISYMFNYTYKF